MRQLPNQNVLLVGWDFAGWQWISPLLDRGEMPVLAKLVEQGVMGDVRSMNPLVAPAVATSVATGQYPDRHGVLGTHEVRDGQVVEVTGPSRQVKAFWDILSQSGRSCDVVNFPWVSPAEAVSGSFVSTRAFSGILERYDESFDFPEGQVVSEHYDTLRRLMVSLADIDAETMRMFVPAFETLDPADPRLVRIGRALAKTFSIHAMATWLLEEGHSETLSVNYPLIDLLAPEFLKYVGPKLPWVDDAGFELCQHIMPAAAKLLDMLLGRLLELAGDEASAIVYSPASYLSHAQLASLSPAAQHQPGAWAWAEGLFAMRVAGGRQDELIHRVSLVDICPTMLQLSGVSPAADMDGRMLWDALADPTPIEPTVASWEQVPPIRENATTRESNVFNMNDVGFFARYTDLPGQELRLENAWRLGDYFEASPRRHLTTAIYTELYHTHPLGVDRAPQVAEALYLTAHVPEALAIMDPIAKSFPDAPMGKFMAGMLAVHENELYEALDLFEAAVRDAPQMHQLFYYLGQVCLALGRSQRAIEAYRRTLELQPDFFLAYVGLSEAYLHNRQPEDAVEAALGALTRSFKNFGGHFALAKALMVMGETQQAMESLGVAIRLAPKHPMILHYAKQLGDAGEDLLAKAAAMPAPLRPGAGGRGGSPLTKAYQRISHWQTTYMEDVARAETLLDDYLAGNAAKLGIDLDAQTLATMSAPAGSAQETEWVVRPAMPSDQPDIKAMFEDPFSMGVRREMLILHPLGVDDVHGAIWLHRHHIRPTVGLGLSVRRAPDGSDTKRETFLMMRLLRAAVARAAAGQAEKVTFLLPGDQEGSLPQCLDALGFGEQLRQTEFRFSMEKLRDVCMRIVRRYERNKTIPPKAQIVVLTPQMMDSIEAFFQRYFTDGLGLMREELAPHCSRAIVVDGEIIASYIGAIREGTILEVPRLAVKDEYRGSWVTPLLMGHGAVQCYDDGLRELIFHTDERIYPEFAKIARRHLDAVVTGSTRTMSLLLATPWPESSSPIPDDDAV